MGAWSKREPAEYLGLKLHAHELLADVPLHDVWRVDLPGGGPGRTLEDVRSLLGLETIASLGPVVRGLFRLRALLGRLFRWDAPRGPKRPSRFLEHLDDDLRRASLVEPGSADGPFCVLYVHSHEAVSEVVNATVHAFCVFALVERDAGYSIYWAIHVAAVGRLTPFYMALIDPFRRWIVYPSILRHTHRQWCEFYAEDR